jgi:hypothetical protein
MQEVAGRSLGQDNRYSAPSPTGVPAPLDRRPRVRRMLNVRELTQPQKMFER